MPIPSNVRISYGWNKRLGTVRTSQIMKPPSASESNICRAARPLDRIGAGCAGRGVGGHVEEPSGTVGAHARLPVNGQRLGDCAGANAGGLQRGACVRPVRRKRCDDPRCVDVAEACRRLMTERRSEVSIGGETWSVNAVPCARLPSFRRGNPGPTPRPAATAQEHRPRRWCSCCTNRDRERCHPDDAPCKIRPGRIAPPDPVRGDACRNAVFASPRSHWRIRRPVWTPRPS